ncbi:MAG TPA: dipeptide epimerase [Firmicutes bacterium]|nr:dipeptide epimerase [Bacillota bacterium]
MKAGSKITNVQVQVVEVPLKKQWQISLYKANVRRHAIVRVSTESGVVGYGEASPSPAFMGEGADGVATVIRTYLAPAVTGLEIFDVEKLHLAMDGAIAGNEAAKSAIDIAVHDAMGKLLDEPLYRLLGGNTKAGRVALSWVVSIQGDAEAIEEAKRYAAMGFRTIKLKIGKEPKRDVAIVEAVAKALGDGVAIRLDANQGYDVGTAVRVIREIEEKVPIESVEQPVPRWNLEGLKVIRSKVATPIMVDEAIFGPQDALKVITAGACDIVNIKIGKVGGIWPARKVAAIAGAAGVPCTVGSNLELSIGSAAALHFAAATAAVKFPSDLLIGPFLHEHDVTEKSLSEWFSDGYGLVPEVPGLGVVPIV